MLTNSFRLFLGVSGRGVKKFDSLRNGGGTYTPAFPYQGGLSAESVRLALILILMWLDLTVFNVRAPICSSHVDGDAFHSDWFTSSALDECSSLCHEGAS